ncbi:DinB family protein [Muriicola sp. Z0-33]|uniref:DinB family protein n=1 Tax=Muriicola sp. Z0-33 TaxID=2816957 RepID=UPI002237C362|nr:DinB family protein [Muriicola sp. Z0-33]MCW5517744.1 DinB family protein [Muriicola sp. Z0-33]
MEFQLDQAVLILERTPAVMEQLLRNLPKDLSLQNEGGDSWSPFDVMGHLIHGEKTDWLVRTEIILQGNGNGKFEPFDRLAQFNDSKSASLEELLSEFSRLRKENLALLKSKNISDSDLRKSGEHPELGTVTLAQLLAAWVVHDLGHITQVSRVMAKQYKTAVGPWKKYLTILNTTPRE